MFLSKNSNAKLNTSNQNNLKYIDVDNSRSMPINHLESSLRSPFKLRKMMNSSQSPDDHSKAGRDSLKDRYERMFDNSYLNCYFQI